MAEPGKVPSVAPEAIVERFRGRLVVFAARRLRDREEAEDAAQEALRRVIAALEAGRIRDADALPGFVFETARHVCQQRERKQARGERAFARMATEPAAAGPDPLTGLIDDERRDQVRRALGELPDGDRQLLRMFFQDDRSVSEIATILGLHAGAIRVRKHRALRRMGERLAAIAGNDPAPSGTDKG